jgi:diadenosine tetraphosphate (Ap4A) HIT family hydrolase
MPCVIRRYNPNAKKRKEEAMSDCIFCKNLPKVLENDLVYAVYDIKPTTRGHMLFIPKRHFKTIFEATPEEIKAVFDLMAQVRPVIEKEHGPDGYNVQANCGEVAGQIVMHAHIHLIPRYKI